MLDVKGHISSLQILLILAFDDRFPRSLYEEYLSCSELPLIHWKRYILIYVLETFFKSLVVVYFLI